MITCNNKIYIISINNKIYQRMEYMVFHKFLVYDDIFDNFYYD